MGSITGFVGRPQADRAPLKHWIADLIRGGSEANTWLNCNLGPIWWQGMKQDVCRNE